jgi:hypothetical protein
VTRGYSSTLLGSNGTISAGFVIAGISDLGSTRLGMAYQAVKMKGMLAKVDPYQRHILHDGPSRSENTL